MQAPDSLGGRYELRGILGRGGMAEVRDGWDRRLDRPVAVKLLYPAFSAAPDIRRRFEVEARAAAGLNHPHIVAVHDSGEHAGAPFIVMERLSGRTLADEMASGPLPQGRVRAILDDVLSALTAAHAAGILHRDIKPANILLTPSGDLKVADFGIAKSEATPATMTGQIVGTMAYLSPDRIAGRPASIADDLYAVGAVGYEALSGRKPFPQENIVELARAIVDTVPPPLQALRPDVEPALVATIERAMAPDPQWRFPTAEAMRSALYMPPPVAQHNPARPPTRVMAEPLPPPLTMAVGPAAGASRNRKAMYIAAALFAIALAAILILFESASPSPTPKPATTATSVTSSSTTPSAVPPPPPPPPPRPAPVDQGPPGKKKGHGNGKKGD